ncbi:MAG: NYN domain-containing protein [Candidatus Parcubacteria bacterium]|nr:MAG: NYN domain-containing protein [Candidatus Parcubacteria bacterium]
MNPLHYQNQRVAIFIDTQNIYHSARNFYNKKIDFANLVKLLTGERSLIRAIAYVVKSNLSPKEISFFETLIQKGIELRIKEMIHLPDGEKKADWDVGITVDAIRISRFADTIILVTGDGDFVPLVEYLKNQGNIIEIAGFSKNTSIKLKELADYFYNLEEFKKYILIS